MKHLAVAYPPALDAAVDVARQFLGTLDDRHIGATVDVATLRQRLCKPLEAHGIDAADVIRDLAADVEGGLLAMPGPRFFAWAIGGSLPSALAADWLTSTWDQNAALYACSPAASIVEETAGAWLKDLLAIPHDASFAFTTGCQMAHVTCLAAARNALLADAGWNVETRGLSGAPRIRIISTNQRHSSIDRAVRLLGLGNENVTYGGDDLERALAADPETPTIVQMQAGDLNTGAFDDFATLIPIAKRFNAWVHVDGAFGLWAAASPRYRSLVAGAERADSWATDGHKWLNVPFDSGYAFVANPTAHRNAMSIRAPYIAESAVARDQIDWNPEWSRRARGFPTYAAIRELGRAGIAGLIDRTCDLARLLLNGITSLPNVELLVAPTINQGLVRFLDPASDATEANHDAQTERVIDAIVAGGEAYFGATTWNGKRAMRVSVLNWQTSSDDVGRTLEAIRRCVNP